MNIFATQPTFHKTSRLASAGDANNMLSYKLIDIESLVLSAQQFITVIRMFFKQFVNTILQ